MINDPFFRKCGPQVTGITFIESLTYFFMVVVYFLWSTVRSFYRIMLVSVTVAHISVKIIKSPMQWMPRRGVAIFTPQSVSLQSRLTPTQRVIAYFVHEICHDLFVRQ